MTEKLGSVEKTEGSGDDSSYDRRTLFVRSIPFDVSGEELSQFFSSFAPVKHAVIVTDGEKRSRGFGFVTFASEDDVVDALIKAKETKYKGRLLRVDRAMKRDRKNKDQQKAEKKTIAPIEKRRARLIVRNLPWSCKNPEELKEIFSKYGKVFDAYIPRKKGGQMCGFGFVVMKKQAGASKAVSDSEGMKIHGREVAVDYAIEKSKWEEVKEQESANEEMDGQSEDEELHSSGDGGENSVNDGETSEPSKLGAKNSHRDQATGEFADDVGEMKEDRTGLSDNSDSDLDEFGSKVPKELEGEDDMHESESLDDEENVDNEDNLSTLDSLDGNGSLDNDEGLDDEKIDVDEKTKRDAESMPKPKRNRQEAYSVFVRNLPYDADAESLKLHFSTFGSVKYALPVVDKVSGLPRGTAFVAFAKADDYARCLENAPETASSSILIADDVDPAYAYMGRVLHITPAVDRDSAQLLAERKRQKKELLQGKGPESKDKRNLFLVNEGRITEKLRLAPLLTPSELELRDKSYNLRVQQLNKNPSLHLSLTRLAIRNIPRAMNSKALKQLARKAVVNFASEAKEGKRQPISKEELKRSVDHKHRIQEAELKKKNEKHAGVVRQAKIIQEVKGSGEVGRSRGYGFIEYRDHKSALMGLRWLNAHEVSKDEITFGMTEEQKKISKTISDPKRRLVVEFALENAKVVKRRQEKILHTRLGTKRTSSEKDIPASSVNTESKKRKVDSKSGSSKQKQATSTKSDSTGTNVTSKDTKKSKIPDNVKKVIGLKRKQRKRK